MAYLCGYASALVGGMNVDLFAVYATVELKESRMVHYYVNILL